MLNKILKLIISLVLSVFLSLPNTIIAPSVLATSSALELLNTFPTSSPRDVAVYGNYAYVAGYSVINIIDISNPLSPQIVGEFSKPFCFFRSIDVVGETGFATQALYQCAPINSLYVIDVSDPSNPQQIGDEPVGIPGPGPAEEIVVLGNYAYIANSQGGLRIINISDLSNPEISSTYHPLPGRGFSDLAVVGNYVYLAVNTGGFAIVDVSNPSFPSLVGSFDLPPGSLSIYSASGISVHGNYVYLAGGGAGLKIFDVSDFNNVYEVGDIPTPGYARDVEVAGNYALIADTQGIVLLDVSNPEDPFIVDSYTGSSKTYRLKVYGKYVYGIDYDLGLLILRYDHLPSVGPQPPVPFLDLPWDYEGKGMSFTEAALAINSYFDHEYPLLSSGLGEPGGTLGYDNEKPLLRQYSSHDGYDYGKAAKTKNGEPVLAGANGIATFHNECGACGNAIYIDHGNGFQTRYYHLSPNGLVTDQTNPVVVDQGQQIGLVGFSGRVLPVAEQGSHIHFMVVEDKNGDGNFDDNIPDGVTDPFGWQSTEPDPWPNYNFFYTGQQRIGNESFYLFTQPIANLSSELTSNGGSFEVEQYSVTFPQDSTEANLLLNFLMAPWVQNSEIIRSIGTSIEVKAQDILGNPVTSFQNDIEINVDFNGYDLSTFDTDTISIYSSSDGINWLSEPTVVDLGSKTASAHINHLSFFALLAERLDTIAPTTEINLVGEELEGNHFRSVVELTLNAQDNDGGLGVDYTLYKFNEEDWQEYAAPVVFNEEGIYNLEFYSVDDDENIEEIKSVDFVIDKSEPEIKFTFNRETLDTDINIIDNSETTYYLEDLARGNEKLVVIDSAGNKTEIVGTFNFETTADEVKVTSITYNDTDVFNFGQNRYNNLYQLYRESENLLAISQGWSRSEPEQFGVVINYNEYTNQSRIITKTEIDESTEEFRDGLVLLYVQTNDGNLEFEYE